jgi:putative peptidoglycan lipid II flippase
MILGTIWLAPTYGIYAPAIGVLFGAVLHLMIQIPILKNTGMKFHLFLNLRDKGIREIIALMPPRILSVLIANLLATVNNSLAILISASSVVYLKFANQLQFFPVNLFGVSLAAAALPTLSNQVGEEDKEEFKKTFLTSLHQMFFLVIPSSVILMVLRIPVVRLVYGVSNFPWEATVKTSYALAFFSISIFSQSAVYLITRAFYALKDTKTPVMVSSISIVINVLLSVIFIRVLGFGVWSVAFSFSVTSIFDMIIMLFLLSREIGGFDAKLLFVPFTKICYAALFMGICLYLPLKLLDQVVFDTTRTLNLIVLTSIAGVAGMSAYLIFTHILKVEEIELFYKLMRKLKLVKSPYVATADTQS